MSHANLHLDTNARLTDTCVWQKVQAAITARQGKTCPFKHSERSLEIFIKPMIYIIRYAPGTLLINFWTNFYERHHSISPEEIWTISKVADKVHQQPVCWHQITMSAGLHDCWQAIKKHFRWVFFYKKGAISGGFHKNTVRDRGNSAPWMAHWSRLTFLSYSCSSSGNGRHIQTHKLYHPWLSLLNVWSSHNISLLSRW